MATSITSPVSQHLVWLNTFKATTNFSAIDQQAMTSGTAKAALLGCLIQTGYSGAQSPAAVSRIYMIAQTLHSMTEAEVEKAILYLVAKYASFTLNHSVSMPLIFTQRSLATGRFQPKFTTRSASASPLMRSISAIRSRKDQFFMRAPTSATSTLMRRRASSTSGVKSRVASMQKALSGNVPELKIWSGGSILKGFLAHFLKPESAPTRSSPASSETVYTPPSASCANAAASLRSTLNFPSARSAHNIRINNARVLTGAARKLALAPRFIL